MRPNKIAKTKDMPSDVWLSHRMSGIGGSDAAAAIGIGKYKTMYELYKEKALKIRPFVEENDAMYFGTILETIVAHTFTKRTGLKVKNNNYLLQHPEHLFMYANLDREGVDEKGNKFVLECKTANSFLQKEWEKGIPLHYQMQVLHYLIVTGYRYAYVACLVGGQKFFIHKLEPTQQDRDELVKREKYFWNLVLDKTPPQVDNPTLEYPIADLLSAESSTFLIDDEFDNDIEQIQQLKADAKELKAKIDKLENNIKAELGEQPEAHTKKYYIRWTNAKRTSFDSKKFKAENPDLFGDYTKETTYRKFTIKEM